MTGIAGEYRPLGRRAVASCLSVGKPHKTGAKASIFVAGVPRFSK